MESQGAFSQTWVLETAEVTGDLSRPPSKQATESSPKHPRAPGPGTEFLERPKPSKGIRLGPLPHHCVLHATGGGGSLHPEAVSPPSAGGLEPEHSPGHPPGSLGLRILMTSGLSDVAGICWKISRVTVKFFACQFKNSALFLFTYLFLMEG